MCHSAFSLSLSERRPGSEQVRVSLVDVTTGGEVADQFYVDTDENGAFVKKVPVDLTKPPDYGGPGDTSRLSRSSRRNHRPRTQWHCPGCRSSCLSHPEQRPGEMSGMRLALGHSSDSAAGQGAAPQFAST